MRVLLDARKLGDGGIGVYIRNLVQGLLELEEFEAGVSSLTLLCSPHQQITDITVEEELSGLGKIPREWLAKVELVVEGARKYSPAEYFSLPRRHREIITNSDVYHSPHYTLPFLSLAGPVPAGNSIASIVTVHDAIHVTHPDGIFHRPIGKYLIGSALKRATLGITVSESARKKLTELFPFASHKLRAIPNALRRESHLPNEKDISSFMFQKKLKRPYTLFIGSDRPHKGFAELLQAFKLLCDDLGEAAGRLVCVGERFSRESFQLAERLGLSERVHYLGAVSEKELKLLYHGAKLVAVPSREEGFGFCALEALRFGVPLVCTPVASLKEICADAATFSAGFSPEEIYHALKESLLRKVGRTEMIEKGKQRAKRFSLKAKARSTYATYCEALNIQPGGKLPAGRESGLDTHEAAALRAMGGR